jgi:hypothetical protein
VRLDGIALAVAALTLAVAVAVPRQSSARTTSERPASILIFPKIVSDGTRDTFVQISNTANSVVHAHCFYVNAYPVCQGIGDCQQGTCSGRCLPQWQEIDFNITLTKQQPAHWGAGLGRIAQSGDGCSFNTDTKERNYDCYGSGLPTLGRIPPVSAPFEGELRCIEVDQSGAPISGNHLKGEATLIHRDGDASKYNAIGILGEPFTNNGDQTLCLGGPANAQCPTGAEYEGCPDRFWIPHFAAGADNPILGPTSTVRTAFTVVPCQVDYELSSLNLTRVTLQFRGVNEFEQLFSASTAVECWRSFFLDEVNPFFRVQDLQTRLVHTLMRPSEASPSSIAAIVEETHQVPSGATARAAFNAHELGDFAVNDDGVAVKNEIIVLPAGP